MPLPNVLKELLALPTAPYLEDHVVAYVDEACRKLAGVKLKYDRYGNLLAHYRYQPRQVRPLAFAAHLDHPGFEATQMKGKQTLLADFRGGVRPEYFKDAKVRFWVDGKWVKGKVTKLTKVAPPSAPGRPRIPKAASLQVSKPVPPGTLGMWDLPDPALRGERITARACDDLAGVGAMLELLRRLSRKKAHAEVYCLFSRAEEVGFVGAVGAIKARTVPKRAAVISIETSSALVNAPIGDGPIIRVGDRGTIYTPALTDFSVRVAQRLARRRKKFQFQRKLMDGGMCEAAAFGAYGYTVSGICLALGNYHNMDTKKRRIASEWVSLQDWQAMVDLFEAMVLDEQGPGKPDNSLHDRIEGLFNDSEHLLNR